MNRRNMRWSERHPLCVRVLRNQKPFQLERSALSVGVPHLVLVRCMTSLRTLLLWFVFVASALAGPAKTLFTDDDLGLSSRAELVKLLGYPAEIEVLDPHLRGGIGASSAWTYYFESRDHKIRNVHFMLA